MMTAALLRTVDHSYVIETGVPVDISALEKSNFMANRWKHYILWFGMGSIWGFLTELATIGMIYLTIICEVDDNMWFSRSIVAIITIVCVAGPFLLRLLVLRFVAVATVRTNVDTTFLDNMIMSCVVFGQIGSAVSDLNLVIYVKIIPTMNICPHIFPLLFFLNTSSLVIFHW
jgi:hypothetical protein